METISASELENRGASACSGVTAAESQCFLHKSGGSGARSTYTVTSLFILMLEFQFFYKHAKGQREGWNLLRKEESIRGREERNAQVRSASKMNLLPIKY